VVARRVVTAAAEDRPGLLVEEVGDGVDERLDEGEGAADGQAAGHRVADAEGHAHVDGGEREGLGHGSLLHAGHGPMIGAACQ